MEISSVQMSIHNAAPAGAFIAIDANHWVAVAVIV
jgi:hypothetical protein